MKIWQITCSCGQSLPVAMHQCGLPIACPHCQNEVVVPSSMELRELPSNVDSHGQIMSSSGELVRVDSPTLCNQFRARLNCSDDLFYRASNFFVVSQSVAGTVALALSDGLSESQVLPILDELLPALKVSKASQEILATAKAMQQDAAGMWLKRVWFSPFESGWLGCVHVLMTAVIASTFGLYFLVNTLWIQSQGEHQCLRCSY